MIEEKIVNEFKKDIKKKTTAFIVGAGISIPAPSYLTILPQEYCINNISNLDASTVNKLVYAIRPEVFYQVLYNVIGNRALQPLEILNPKMLNSEDLLVSPNAIHYFLAEKIKEGYVVITTNFDSLIEEAYEQITRGKRLNLIIYENDFNLIYPKINRLKSGILIKFHGSFYDQEEKDCRDTIRLMLQQVQKEFPDYKRQLLIKLIQNFDFVIMGYSGRDDYDLFTYLLNPPSERKIWWIKHLEESDPTKWNIISIEQLKEKNKVLGSLPSLKRTPDDWEDLNANSIVLAYSKGKLINAHTINFLNYLNLCKNSELSSSSPSKISEKVQLWMKKWANSINLAEKNEILASLFETVGGSYLKNAQDYFDKASHQKISLIEANRLLSYGRINYKNGNYKEADDYLKLALKIFQDLESITGQADLYQLLLLINNRLKNVELGRMYGEKAFELYLQTENFFELAQVLRGLALITMTGIPDVYTIENLNEKNHCIRLLEEAINLCNKSLEVLKKAGNRTGERGENQTLNVLGLIYLRLGKFEEARNFFEEFLNLSGKSRFLRESFQGYRNLALSLYNLSKQTTENKTEYLEKCLKSYEQSIISFGGDPTNPSYTPKNREEFITQFNRSKALLESSDKIDIEFALKELEILKDVVLTLFSTKEAWHWHANVLTQLYIVNWKSNNKMEIDIIKNLINDYNQQDDITIANQSFGIQNAKENVQYIIQHIEKLNETINLEDIYKELMVLLKRINNLKLPIPSTIPKDWSRLISQLNIKY